MANERRVIHCKKHNFTGEECPGEHATTGRKVVVDSNTPGHFCSNHSTGVIPFGEECKQCRFEKERKTPEPKKILAEPSQKAKWFDRNAPRG